MNYRVRKALGLERKPKQAVVLGCGPAGLFATHALVSQGYNVEIYSRKRKSEMFGAQYLHSPIPGLSNPNEDPVLINYRLSGSVDGYREKVYGRRSGISVSAETLDRQHYAWDIRAAYSEAWSQYGSQVQDTSLNAEAIGSLLMEISPKTLVVSSLPAMTLCHDDEHVFDYQKIWAVGDAPERGIFCPIEVAADNEVLLNGDHDTGWYRAANVYGYRTAEWPEGRKPPLTVAEVLKPLSTNCDCFPSIRRVGRYGKWTKGVLAHQAYREIMEGL